MSETTEHKPPPTIWRVPDELREKIEPILVKHDPPKKRRRIRWEKRYPAPRRVVERTHLWLSKCRAILVRYQKKTANHLGLTNVACSLLEYCRQHLLSLFR